jgi:hypothetical protein
LKGNILYSSSENSGGRWGICIKYKVWEGVRPRWRVWKERSLERGDVEVQCRSSVSKMAERNSLEVRRAYKIVWLD